MNPELPTVFPITKDELNAILNNTIKLTEKIHSVDEFIAVIAAYPENANELLAKLVTLHELQLFKQLITSVESLCYLMKKLHQLAPQYSQILLNFLQELVSSQKQNYQYMFLFLIKDRYSFIYLFKQLHTIFAKDHSSQVAMLLTKLNPNNFKKIIKDHETFIYLCDELHKINSNYSKQCLNCLLQPAYDELFFSIANTPQKFVNVVSKLGALSIDYSNQLVDFLVKPVNREELLQLVKGEELNNLLTMLNEVDARYVGQIKACISSAEGAGLRYHDEKEELIGLTHSYSKQDIVDKQRIGKKQFGNGWLNSCLGFFSCCFKSYVKHESTINEAVQNSTYSSL
ncbi:MAG: hypothetical protein Tsb005_03900 [Gammaproteobacteria bacterium]